MTLESGIEIPTDKIADLCRRHGIQELSVFGSAARGDMGPESDIDIMVEFFPGVVHGWDYFGIETELAQMFGRHVDLATKKWLKPDLRARILPEARIVYEA
jgi:predicted nucleotidyltransferase